MNISDLSNDLGRINDERPVKLYKALITQEGAGAASIPTAVVIKNTLGNVPVFTKTATGSYKLSVSDSIFTASKTIAKIRTINGASQTAYVQRASATVIDIFSGYSGNDILASLADDKLTSVPLVIEVYS